MTAAAASRVATAARHLSTSMPAHREVKRMTVFGAGLMGSGIVQIAAQAGIRVTMVDTNEKALEWVDIGISDSQEWSQHHFKIPPSRRQKAVAR